MPDATVMFVLVDDSGGQDPRVADLPNTPDLVMIRTPYNLGHQAAIVFGLRRLSPVVTDSDYVVTMDSDGEDRPEDIPTLLKPLISQLDNLFAISLAQRTKRNESLSFKVLYFGFKMLFLLLTGTVVRNGNFAAFRGWFLRHSLFHPYFDYCYSSSLLALPANRVSVPLSRGTRYYGKSKMTLLSLLSHGFRMLLPFAERIAVRGILLASVLILIAGILCPLGFVQFMASSPWRFVLLGIAVSLVALSLCIVASSCLFFQVFNQTKAISLRSLTCQPSEVTHANSVADKFISA